MLARHDLGSDDWWRAVAQQGTPWVELYSPGRCAVTFLWRDPMGCRRTSAIRRVWVYICGVTDHHSHTAPQSLERIDDTDVWCWRTVLGSGWRGSYCFIPCCDAAAFSGLASAEPLDPVALREGWGGVLSGAVADPLNPLPAWTGGRGHQVSGLHMPQAPAQPAWDEFDRFGPLAGRTLPPLPAPATLERHCWHSQLLGNSRDIWIFTTGQRQATRRPLALLLDGQFWAREMPLWSPLIALTQSGELPEAVYVLVDAIDTRQRAQELTCNPAFWQALRLELLPQVAKWASYRADAASTVVAGQSFGGLSALYAALHWPQLFGCVLSQSGSFWWPNRDMTSKGSADMSCQLLADIDRGLGAGQGLKLYIEAGAREPLVRQVNDRAVEALRFAGHQVNYRVVDGGHDALCWRGGLLDGLTALWGGLIADTRYP